MRVLVTGATGQLGHDLVRVCALAGDEVVALGHSDLDVTDRTAVHRAIAAATPHVIVHCAAWTAVDACEGDEARAMSVNAAGAGNVAEAAAASHAHLVHVSTDYVFSGETNEPYIETDATEPINVYGRSKRAGELAVLEACPDATVVRTSRVCGEHGANMVKTVLRLSQGTGPMRFVDDQTGCPTFTTDLAPMLRTLADVRASGIVHVTNSGVVTWYAFAQAILRAAGRDPDLVVPISTDELHPPRPARRPRCSALRSTALPRLGIAPLAPFEEPLARLVARLTA